MQTVVYADMLFLVNWLMDYALLWAVSAVLGLKAKKKRLIAAAAVGAGWVCLITVIRLPSLIESLISFAGISCLMLWIAFRTKRLKALLMQLAVLYAIAILGGGLVNLLYFHTTAGYYLKTLVWGQERGETASAAMVAVCGAAIAAGVTFIRRLLFHRQKKSRLYEAELFLGGHSVKLTGLLDTGNRLKEPVTGKAVHIAEKRVIEDLEKQEGTVRLLIPYHAVGTESGLLTALRIDRMELVSEDQYRITVEQPLIGLYEGMLSTGEEYQMILHAEIETRQGEKL